MKHLWSTGFMCSFLWAATACTGSSDSETNNNMPDASMGLSSDLGRADQGLSADLGEELDVGTASRQDAGRMFPPHVTGLTRHTLEHDGLIREYIVYIPESYSPNQATPLLLNFHGNGGDADDHLSSADMRPISDDSGAVLVYPQGSVLDG